jgi:hypothetical protein
VPALRARRPWIAPVGASWVGRHSGGERELYGVGIITDLVAVPSVFAETGSDSDSGIGDCDLELTLRGGALRYREPSTGSGVINHVLHDLSRGDEHGCSMLAAQRQGFGRGSCKRCR